MRKLFTTSLLALAVAALFAAATAYAQDLQALITTDDEAALIETIQKPGDAPQDILVKNGVSRSKPCRSNPSTPRLPKPRKS